MSAGAASHTLKEFTSDLERVDQLLAMIDAFRSFAAGTVDSPGDGDGQGAERTSDLRSRFVQVRTDIPVLSGALLLYVCGRFEYFVREVIEVVVDDLVDKASAYSDLPEVLRRQHRDGVLEANRFPKRYEYNPEDATRLLSELLSESDASDFSVTPAVISVTDSNLRSGMLADLFKRVDIPKIWDELGKQNSLKAHLSERNDGKCAQQAKNRLDELMSLRNKIAHPTKDTRFPGTDVVRGHIGYLAILGREIVGHVQIPRN